MLPAYTNHYSTCNHRLDSRLACTCTNIESGPTGPTYTVCDSCLPGLVNDDWTHLDAQCVCRTAEHDGHDDDCAAEQEHAVVLSWMELVGWLTPAGDAGEPGYFDCECCGATQCGGGHTMRGAA